MPRCCSIGGCKSNYRGHEQNVSTFGLPKEDSLLSEWLKNIPTDFKGIKKPIVCEKHFTEDCILRVDRILDNGKWKEFPRQIPKLKTGSVPTIFPSQPQAVPKTSRTSKNSPNVKNQNIIQATRNCLFDNKTKFTEAQISSSDTVVSHYLRHINRFRKEWALLSDDRKIVFCFIDISGKPSLTASVSVFKNLDFEVIIGHNQVPKKSLPDTCQVLNCLRAFDEIMEFVESKF